jgi:hypothetical protein
MKNLISKLFRPAEPKNVPPALNKLPRSNQWKAISQDIITIATVVFFATTIQCWYVVNFQDGEGHQHFDHNLPVPKAAEVEPTAVVKHTLSCDVLKDIYDKAYLEQLGKVDDIDFLAIDKSFYETYGECL